MHLNEVLFNASTFEVRILCVANINNIEANLICGKCKLRFVDMRNQRINVIACGFMIADM